MLSVLIPVYNFDVRELVKDLHEQCVEAGIAFEILVFDDQSKEYFQQLNGAVAEYTYVKYQVLPQNVGRSRIRNQLASAANYPYLLFMDGDSKVVRGAYIHTYLQHLHPQKLLYGGRSYALQPPADPHLHFHWWYGSQREVMLPAKRQEQPHHAFMTNNFLIPKALFEPIGFDERLLQYGHEDTLFGLELQKRHIPILHLDNPIEHIGLEPRDQFLAKSEKAIENLHFLAQAYPQLSTKLLRIYRKVKQYGLTGLFLLVLKPLRPLMQKKLEQEQPDLRWFDLYKLLLLLEKEVANQAR
ncbi:MAG: glycosyltransferase [Bacteroidota bacterium]